MNPIHKYFIHNDVTRCDGVRVEEKWRNGCERCLRRIAGPASTMTSRMYPPPLDTLGDCWYLIAMEETTDDSAPGAR